jgi:hypothetical protein
MGVLLAWAQLPLPAVLDTGRFGNCFGNLILSNIGNILFVSCDADHRLCFGLLIATLVEFVLAKRPATT